MGSGLKGISKALFRVWDYLSGSSPIEEQEGRLASQEKPEKKYYLPPAPKEYGFPKSIPTLVEIIYDETKKRVSMAGLAESLSEAYRSDLEAELGYPYLLSGLQFYNIEEDPGYYFYQLKYDGKDLGIILPEKKLALLGNRFLIDAVVDSAFLVLAKRGYDLHPAEGDPFVLVDLAHRIMRGDTENQPF